MPVAAVAAAAVRCAGAAPASEDEACVAAGLRSLARNVRARAAAEAELTVAVAVAEDDGNEAIAEAIRTAVEIKTV